MNIDYDNIHKSTWENEGGPTVEDHTVDPPPSPQLPAPLDNNTPVDTGLPYTPIIPADE